MLPKGCVGKIKSKVVTLLFIICKEVNFHGLIRTYITFSVQM